MKENKKLVKKIELDVKAIISENAAIIERIIYPFIRI